MTSLNASKEKITRIIKALLAKAAGTDNEAEAAIFTEKAHAMMERYQVDVNDVLKDDPIERNIPYKATSSNPSYKKFLWRSLAHYYGCKTMLLWKSATVYEIHIIGRESSRVTAELMYPFVMDQVRKVGTALWLAGDPTKSKESVIRDVANSLIIRINNLVAEQRANDPKVQTQGGKNALVATNAINALMKQLYPNAENRKGRVIGTSPDAKSAAERISLHRQTGTNTVGRLT